MYEIADNFNYLIPIIGFIVPLLTAVAKKYGSPDWQSGLITLTLAGAGTFVHQLVEVGLDGLEFDEFIGTLSIVYGTALGSWLGLTSDVTAQIQKRIPGGIGTGTSRKVLPGYSVNPETGMTISTPELEPA